MSGIIGRVADAVLADLCVRMDIKEFNAAQYGDPEIWDEIREAVGRAAIAAMREPTSDMSDAAFQIEAAGHSQRTLVEAGWRAMIDAALGHVQDETAREGTG